MPWTVWISAGLMVSVSDRTRERNGRQSEYVGWDKTYTAFHCRFCQFYKHLIANTSNGKVNNRTGVNQGCNASARGPTP